MFGAGLKEKARNVAVAQYESIFNISINNSDKLAAFIAEKLKDAGEIHPTKAQIAECDRVPELIATHLFCADLIQMTGYLSPKNSKIVFAACMKEFASYFTSDRKTR